MPIVVACPSCAAAMRAPDNSAGRNARCPKCQTVFPIPAPSPAPAPMAAAAAVATPGVDRGEGLDFLPDDSSPALPINPYAAPKSQSQPRPSASASFSSRGGGGSLLGVVSGKPASTWGGALVPAMFGRTTLKLLSDRLVEETRRPIESRDCEAPLASVDSAEILCRGNSLLLVVGFLTLGLFGIGLIFFALYIIFKHRFLLIRTQSNAFIVTIKGDDELYRQFLDDVLDRCDQIRRGG